MLILKDIVFGISTKIYGIVLSFGISILLARYFSVEDFGYYNYILAIIGIFSPLLDLGISQILIKEINIEKNINLPITIGILIRIIGSTFSILLFLIILNLGYYDVDNVSLIVILIIFSLKISDIFQYIFEAQQKFKLTFIIPIISSSFFLIISFIFILFKIRLSFFLILKIFEEGIKTIFYIIYFKKNNRYKFCFKKEKFLYMLKQAIPLLLSGIAMVLYLRIDQIMIGKILGKKEVALYSIGIKFAEVWYFVPSMIASIYYPKLVKLFTNNISEYNRIKKQLYCIEVFLSLLFAVFISLISKYLITFVYGENYLISYRILNIYIWAGIPYSLLAATSKVLILNQKNKEVFYRSFITAVLNIILNYVFIKRMGIKGAAYSTLISYIFIIISLGFVGCKNEIKDIFIALSLIFKYLKLLLYHLQKKEFKR